MTLAFTGNAYAGYNYDYTEYGGTQTYDDSLFDRLLYTHGTPESMDYSGLTAGLYDLVVYSDNVSGGTITFDVNGVAQTLISVAETSLTASPGNYLLVEDVVVGSDGKLDITGLETGSQGISGLQIESVPEPSALSMFVGGAMLLVFFLRRKLAANS